MIFLFGEKRPIAGPVLITGASSGIGRALALEIAKRKIPLALGARNVSRLAEVAEEVQKTGTPVFVHPLDVTQLQSCQEFVAAVLAHFGSVGTLVNNAGIGVYGPVHETAPEDFDTIMKTNVYGPFFMIQAVLPSMLVEHRGSIVNISSVAGRVSSPFMGIYAATKFALTAMTRAMREELASEGIRVLLVMPGVIRTEFGEHATGSLKELGVESVGRLGAPVAALAQKITRAMETGASEVVFPFWYRPLIAFANAFPRFNERLAHSYILRFLEEARQKEPPSP